MGRGFEVGPPPMPEPGHKSRSRWLFFALGGLLLFIVLSCAGLFSSYQIWRSREQAQQRRAVAAIEAMGGTATPSLSNSKPWTVILEQGDAPNVIRLDGKGITDDDLRVFESAPTTRGLFLLQNQITDEGLVHLKDLKMLETLDLRRNPRITDVGLVHLENLSNLKQVYLMSTGVTPAGVSKLQQKLPNTKIHH